MTTPQSRSGMTADDVSELIESLNEWFVRLL
jgi:hypothetical protein